jgi:hypothetical protein
MNPETRVARARIAISNPDGVLRPGTFVRALLVTDARAQTVTVPDAAVQQDGGLKVVYVKNGDTFERREVAVGESAGGRTQIRSGRPSRRAGRDHRRLPTSGGESAKLKRRPTLVRILIITRPHSRGHQPVPSDPAQGKLHEEHVIFRRNACRRACARHLAHRRCLRPAARHCWPHADGQQRHAVAAHAAGQAVRRRVPVADDRPPSGGAQDGPRRPADAEGRARPGARQEIITSQTKEIREMGALLKNDYKTGPSAAQMNRMKADMRA